MPRLDALPLGAHRLCALTDDRLFTTCGVRIAFTGRGGGQSAGPFASLNCAAHVGDEPRAVKGNRREVLEALGASGCELVVPSQVHGTAVVHVDAPGGSESTWEAADRRESASRARKQAEAGADALVVGVPGVAALLNFADCLPLIVVSPSGRFAVVHAGWRGAVAGIAGKAVRELADADSCPPSAFNAYIGPHIRSECFEVGEEVWLQFAEAFGDGALRGEAHVSLAAAVSADLMRAGVSPERIADARICTKCNPDRYFSYRATQGRCGRNAAAGVFLGQGGELDSKG